MKFDQRVVDGILKDLENGIPARITCESYGVAYPTFKRWIENGTKDLLEEKNTYYTQFLASLRNVHKKVISRHLKRVVENEKGHKGAEWYLERAFWQYFSSKVAEIDLEDRLNKLENKRMEENEITKESA
ncbi:MAG TPA: hypothetical protein VNF93_02405 [Buchnera sp. (in: enterobacteria)]|nr:hypothetical protein [Buchnera sp. (in: enterobacteria)]